MRHQAIDWANADPNLYHHRASIGHNDLTHWGRVTHICVNKLTIISSNNGLSLGRRKAIIWTNAGILLIGPLGKNFSEILIETFIFSFYKMHFKMLSGNLRPFLSRPQCVKRMRHVIMWIAWYFQGCFNRLYWLVVTKSTSLGFS